MKVPATLKWIGLALLGILVAAAVSLAASHLVSRQIGLASEPISAGEALAPRTHTRSERRRARRDDGGTRQERRETEATSPVPPETPAESDSENSGTEAETDD